MRLIRLLSALVLLPASVLHAQQTASDKQFSKEVLKYIRVGAPKVVLTHVRIVDGTGRAAVEDQNIAIEGGKISAITAGETP